ncbi:MAG: TraR/DksA family transcriptional regulator [Pseudomonadales bacterium]|jgi:RNA polymerase-binding transcription factor DksA|nr:TraR/DksA family transcriptional regulator [Pseudomonadales bacterium]
MTDSDAVRARLRARRAELAHRASRVDDDLRRKSEPLSPDFAEQANQRGNDEVLGAIGESARFEISQIDAALARMDRDQYGDCGRCGASIEPARLEAVPYANVCRKCATELEQQRASIARL